MKIRLPGTLRSCPSKRLEGTDYHPVQDLCAINSAVITIHPVVPNPYTLLSLLPTQASWPTCSISRTHSSAFSYHEPARPCLRLNGKTHILGETQLAWTRLPQGFKSSPILFGEALAVDLAAFPRETLNCALLQYLEDLLLASPTQGDCWRGTKALLALLSTTGYRCLGKRLRSADRKSSTSEELIQSAKEICWLTRHPRRQRYNRAPQ